MVPAHNALGAILARSGARFGARALMPPIWTPSDAMFANPHNA